MGWGEGTLHVALVRALSRRGAVRAGPARIADTDAVVAVALAVAAGWTGKLRHEGVGPGGAGRHGQHEPAPRAGSAPHDNPALRHTAVEREEAQGAFLSHKRAPAEGGKRNTALQVFSCTHTLSDTLCGMHIMGPCGNDDEGLTDSLHPPAKRWRGTEDVGWMLLPPTRRPRCEGTT